LEIQNKELLGYKICTSSLEEMFEYINERIAEQKNTHIVTINPEMIELAEKNNEFSNVLKTAELVIPDGVGIKIGFKLKGIDINRTAGIEFAYKLLKMSAKSNYSVALIGAKNEILEQAGKNIKKEIPELNILYQRDGYFNESDEKEILENIKLLNIKIVLVAMGAPRQELLINKIKKINEGMVLIGVGGSFDVWSGQVKRAPVIFQKIGLEWLYRTLKQPGRLKRIFPTLPLFLFRVIMDKKI